MTTKNDKEMSFEMAVIVIGLALLLLFSIPSCIVGLFTMEEGARDLGTYLSNR